MESFQAFEIFEPANCTFETPPSKHPIELDFYITEEEENTKYYATHWPSDTQWDNTFFPKILPFLPSVEEGQEIGSISDVSFLENLSLHSPDLIITDPSLTCFASLTYGGGIEASELGLYSFHSRNEVDFLPLHIDHLLKGDNDNRYLQSIETAHPLLSSRNPTSSTQEIVGIHVPVQEVTEKHQRNCYYNPEPCNDRITNRKRRRQRKTNRKQVYSEDASSILSLSKTNGPPTGPSQSNWAHLNTVTDPQSAPDGLCKTEPSSPFEFGLDDSDTTHDATPMLSGVKYQSSDSRWIARWTTAAGQRACRSFSVNIYGYEKARKLAIHCREHGIRRRKKAVSRYTNVNNTRNSPDNVTGVRFDSGQQRWVSSYYEGGKRKFRYFPLKECSFEMAQQKAIDWKRRNDERIFSILQHTFTESVGASNSLSTNSEQSGEKDSPLMNASYNTPNDCVPCFPQLHSYTLPSPHLKQNSYEQASHASKTCENTSLFKCREEQQKPIDTAQVSQEGLMLNQSTKQYEDTEHEDTDVCETKKGALPMRIPGVTFDKKNRRWGARWSAPDGRRAGKYFPVSQYGYENARRLAVKCRGEALKYNSNTFQKNLISSETASLTKQYAHSDTNHSNLEEASLRISAQALNARPQLEKSHSFIDKQAASNFQHAFNKHFGPSLLHTEITFANSALTYPFSSDLEVVLEGNDAAEASLH